MKRVNFDCVMTVAVTAALLFLLIVTISLPTAASVTISVDGDVARTINGNDQIVRETFGLEPGGSWNKYQGQVWKDDSGCFGRIYLDLGGFYNADWRMVSLPDLEGLTEEEKADLIFDPDYWANMNMSQVMPTWPEWQKLAALEPDNVFVLFHAASWQFAAEPVTGRQPASLTQAQQDLINGCGNPWKGIVESIVNNAGWADRSNALNVDRDVYAEICVNLLAKIKALFPTGTKFSVIFDNEPNWSSMFFDKAVLDDIFACLGTSCNYQAGEIAADEWLSQYNLFYSAVKNRFPDVRVGGPDVCDVNFTNNIAARTQWDNYTKRILDNAEGLDFFDHHYSFWPKRAQVTAETMGQYMQNKPGGSSIPTVESEAGLYTFYLSPESDKQFNYGVQSERDWFGYLRIPDLTYGRAVISLPKYFDGFGRAKGVGMPYVMFRPLRGKYIRCDSDTSGVETASAINGNMLTCVALNDTGASAQTCFNIHAPNGATFVKLEAKLYWYDSAIGKIRYANFNPQTLNGSTKLAVNINMPSTATCTLTATLNSSVSPGQTITQNRYGGNSVAFWVQPGTPQSVTVTIPSGILNDPNKVYTLRVGYQNTTSGSGHISINSGAATFELPAHVPQDGNDTFTQSEFPVSPNALQTSNTITFSVNSGGTAYYIEMTSIIAEDPAPSLPSETTQTVNLSVGPVSCALTEEESKTMPAWYITKTDGMSETMPSMLAHWSFDSSENGVVPDLSSNENDGTLTGGATLVSGLDGNALYCDGSGDYMNVADSTSLHIDTDQSFSVSLWLKLATDSSHGIVSRGGSKSISLAAKKLGANTEFPYPALEFEMSSPQSCQTFARGYENLNDAKWHHIVVVRDVSGVDPDELSLLYVDGKYSGSGSGVLHHPIDSADPLCVGLSKQGDYLHGYIDEMTIYDGMLTPKQVRTLYRQIVGCMPTETASCLAVVDQSANRVHVFDAAAGDKLVTLTSGLNTPTYATFGLGGDLFVSNYGNNTIRKYRSGDAADQGNYISNVSLPMGLTFGGDGVLYIGRDYNNASKFDGTTFTEIANNLGKAVRGSTTGYDGVVYIAAELDRNWTGNGFIHRYNPSTGQWLSDWTVTGRTFNPEGIAFGPDANADGFSDLYVANWAGSIDILNGVTGADLGTFISGVTQPLDLIFSADGTMYYSLLAGAVYQYKSGQSTVLVDSSDGLTSACGLAISNPYVPKARLAVLDQSTNEVYIFDAATGEKLTTLTSGLNTPTYATFGTGGDLFVSNYGNNSVRRYKCETYADLGLYTSSVSLPMGLTFGDDGVLYIGRDYNNASKFDGTTLTEIANNLGKAVRGATTGCDGVVYIATELNRSWADNGFIHRYDPSTAQWLSDWTVTGRTFNPEGIAFGPDANADGFSDLYVANWAGSIDILNGVTGADLGTLISGVSGSVDLVFSSDGTMYYSLSSGTVYKYRNGQSSVFADSFDGLTSVGGLAIF